MNLKSVIQTVVMAVIPCGSFAQVSPAASIAELKKAVEERHDVVEERFAEAFRLMNTYHSEIMAVSGVQYYSEYEGGFYPDVAYSADVYDNLVLPQYEFKLQKDDYDVAPPVKIYYYYIIDNNPQATEDNRKAAEDYKAAQKESAQALLDAANDETYDPETRDYWKPGTSNKYDYERYQREYWTWWASARKTALETGVKVANFSKTIEDYKIQYPEHPLLVTHNQKDLEAWTEDHERAVARAQRWYDIQSGAQVSGRVANDPAATANQQAWITWNQNKEQWYKEQEMAASTEYLQKVKDYLAGIASHENSSAYRKATEKANYLLNIASGFYPCGATFTKAEIKWKYPEPSTMEEQIEMLNQISQEVALLSGVYVTLGDASRFGDSLGAEGIGFSGRTNAECGVINRHNYREKILTLWKLLHSMDAIPWPMLCKSYGLNHEAEGSTIVAGSMNLSFGEKATAGSDIKNTLYAHAFGASDQHPGISANLWNPYGHTSIACGNNWGMWGAWGYVYANDDNNFPYVWDSRARSCYTDGAVSSSSLWIASRIEGEGGFDYPAGTTPALDGKIKIDNYGSPNGGAFVGDDGEVKFTVIGDPHDEGVDQSLAGKTPEQVRKIATDLCLAYRFSVKRTYKNNDSYKRLGLPETLNIPVAVTRPEDAGEDEYTMKTTLPVKDLLPASQLDSDSIASARYNHAVLGETVLYAKPAFSSMSESPQEILEPVHVPEVVFGSLKNPSRGSYGLQFPLSLRRAGDDCPTLNISLLANSYILPPSYAGLVNLGFARAISIDGGGPEMTVKHDFSALSISSYLKANDAKVSSFELAAAGGDLGRIVEVQFEDGKLEIEWQNYTHVICKYYLKDDGGGYRPLRSYEVKVQGAAQQLVDVGYGNKYPTGYETVELSKDGKLCARAILVGDDSAVAAANDQERLRVEYLNDVGAVEMTQRVSYYTDSVTTVLKDGASAETLLAGLWGSGTTGRAPEKYVAKFGDHQSVEEPREFPPMPEGTVLGDWDLGETWMPEPFYKAFRPGGYDRKWSYLSLTKGNSLEVIPFIWFPQRITLSGNDWSRDGEFSKFAVNGDPIERSFKIAGMDAVSSASISGNTVTSNLNVGGMQIATGTSVFANNLTKVTHNRAGSATTIEYYNDGEVPWALKKITSPSSTTEYTYTRNGDELKVVETTTGGGSTIVTESVTNGHGGFVSMVRKLNGVVVAQAIATGNAPETLWQPKEVTIISNGISRTHHLEYFTDGSLKSHNDGNDRTDTFEWDVLGRIKSGSKFDGQNLTSTYDGLTTNLSLAGEQAESKSSIYGVLEKLSSTAGAGIDVEKTGTNSSTGVNSYRSEVTSEGRDAGMEFLSDGSLKALGGGLGSPGAKYSYSVQNVNGTGCIAVSSSMLNGNGGETGNSITQYFDGYGRLVRTRAPHPMGGSGNYVDTDYSYNVANRSVTITPPSPSKPITVAFDSNWLKSTISQGGHSVDVETSVSGATVKQTVKDGTRELWSREMAGNTGKVTSSINGKNPVSLTPSSNGNQVAVDGPFGFDFNVTYDKYGFKTATGSVAGRSISGSCSRDAYGNVSGVSLKPPGAGGTVSMDIDKAGQVTSVTSAGQTQNIAYSYANGGKQVVATGAPLRSNFSIEEDSEGHPRSIARAGRDAVQIGGDIRNGSVTYSLVGGIPGQTVTEYYSSAMYPLGRTRSDGSGYSLDYNPNGTLASLRNFDGASLGGGIYDFAFTTDPVRGYPTGFTSSQSSLAMVPNQDGTTASVTYNSTAFTGQAQSYTCSYPSYYDGKPLQEVFGGILAGFKINRVFDPITGQAKKVELIEANQVVHAVDYAPDTFGQLQGITTSGANSFSAVYARPSDYVRTLTAGPVTMTRNLAGDGSARLISVSTEVPAGTYSATFSHVGQNRSGLSLTAPGASGSTWSYTFADQQHQLGQLQSATVVRGAAPGVTLNYNHNASGIRAGTTLVAPNQYTVIRIPGSRTVTVSGRAAAGASVKIELQGTSAVVVTAAADGSFSKTLATPAGAGDGELPVKVTGTLTGAGDDGTNAVMRKDLTVALSPSSFSAVYGAHGALVSDWRWLYHWDSEGRLSGLESIAGTGSNLRIKFAYDDKNRRIQKTVEYRSTDGATVTRTVTTKFIYDGWRLLGEAIDDSTEAPYLRTYTWGLDSFDQSGDGSTVGGLVAIHSKGQTYLPVQDGNGNIVALVNSTGNEVASWERGPFGEVLQSSGNTGLCPFGFATAYTDAETGLAYFGHRFYSPTLGSWLSREPLGELESFNLYSYCHNDPVNKVDWLGLHQVVIGGQKEADDIRIRWLLEQLGELGMPGELPHSPNNAQLTPFSDQSSFGLNRPFSESEYRRALAEIAALKEQMERSLFGATKPGFRSLSPEEAALLKMPAAKPIERPIVETAALTIGANPSPLLADINAGFLIPSGAGNFAMAGLMKGLPVFRLVATGLSLERASLIAGLQTEMRSGALIASAEKMNLLTEGVRLNTVVERTVMSPSAFARSQQGVFPYTGVDRFRDITLKKGTIIYGGARGQSAFYTTGGAFRRVGDSATELWQGLQVQPHRTFGYRGSVTAYEVIEDVPAAFGRALENGQFGPGRLPQIVVPEFQKFLRPIHTSLLSP